MQVHTLQPKTKRKSTKRVGRSGNHGKTSGRGHKGQKARGVPRPAIRDIIKKIPKRRGYGKNRAKSLGAPTLLANINVGVLNEKFEAGAVISPATLYKAGIIRKQKGNLPRVKILGQGDLDKKLVCVRCDVSAIAREKIEKAGGVIK